MKDRVLEKLFLRYRERGEGRALAAVFDLTARELLGVAAHLTRDAGEAEDVLQATFVRAMERAATYDPAQPLRPWLYGILWREAAHLARKRRRLDSGADQPERGVDPADGHAASELPALVREAVERLPAPYREVLAPHLFEERGVHEIASLLGRAPGTVNKQIQRGLERLRQKLPRELAGLAPPTWSRGLARVRLEFLARAGLPQAPSSLAVAGVVVASALTAVPSLWALPLLASAGVWTLNERALPFLNHSNSAPAAPSALPTQEDPMLLLAPTFGLLTAATTPSAPAQREPAGVESVAEKVAALDSLVGELLVLSQPGVAQADLAWRGLLSAKQRIQEEEQRRRRAQNEAQRAGYSQAQVWIEAISQIGDAGRRTQAMQEVEAALAGSASESQLAACRALQALGEVEYDKARFRHLLLPLAENASGELHVAALYALYNTVHQASDRSLALALADDPSEVARAAGPHLLALFFERDLSGPAGAAALRLFTGTTYDQRYSMLSGVWGTRISAELEDYLLKVSRSTDRNDQHDVMYYALSTFDPKSEAVVRRLIEYLPSSDPNLYGRALWGLSYGVQPAQGALVVEAARSLFEARSDASMQESCLGLVGQHAGRELEDWLAGIASDARRPANVRAAADAALEAVRAR